MSYAPELIDPRTDERWASLVTESRASIFHHPEWVGLLNRTYGYGVAACCVSQAGRLRAGLPLANVASPFTGRRLVALPFSDVCGPAVVPSSTGAEELVLVTVAALAARMSRDVEIRAPVEGLPKGRAAGAFLHHSLTLSGDAVDMERGIISSSARRGVAKARKGGLVAERHTSAWALSEFYRLHLRTRRRQGVPIQPRRFIMGLEDLFRDGLGFVMLVRDGSSVTAAAVFLTFNGVLTYKYGASDERRLDARPNNLLFMEAIAWGCGNGYHTLDFGRTDLDNRGLASFKRGWGAEERTLSYTSTVAQPSAVGTARAARILGEVIRRGPPSVSRVTGELLYKYLG